MTLVDPVLAGAPEPGTLLGHRYVLLEEIGRGGHSLVYAARDTTRGEEVALKLLVPSPGGAEAARLRLRREVELVRALAHPNIVAVRELVEDQGAAFVVMDLVRGPDLVRRIRRDGPLPPDAAARVALDLARALEAAHGARILHRDVKPENVLLDETGKAMLADFGCARLDDQPTLTATGALAGTLIYAAPEVLAGHRGDARSDLYALGMTLYEALIGRLPEHPRHLPPAPAAAGHHPRDADPGVPDWLDAIVARATAAAPADRFPTAAAMRAALERRRLEAGAPRPSSAERSRCLVCDGGTLPGSPLCRGCDPASRTDRRYLFVRSAGPAFHRAIAEMIAANPDLAEVGSLADAAAGRRALIAVSVAAAPGLAEWLRQRDVATTTRAPAMLWAAIPGSYYLLVTAGLVAGTVAGMFGSPIFLAASPVVALLLTHAALREVRKPALAEGHHDDSAALPGPANERLRRLPPGPARDLLVDVVRLARDLIEREPRGSGRDRLTGEIDAIVAAASEAARELDAADRTLYRLRDEGARLRRVPPAWWSAVSDAERTRDRLAQSLLELVAALGSARSAAALAATTAGTELDTLTSVLAQPGSPG